MDWTSRSAVTSRHKSCETPPLERSRRSLMRFLARTLRPDRAFSASCKSIHPHLPLLTLLLLVRPVLSFTSPSSHLLFPVSHSSPRPPRLLLKVVSHVWHLWSAVP